MGLEACLSSTPGLVWPSEYKINKPPSAFKSAAPQGLLRPLAGGYSPHVFTDNFICAPRDLRLV